VADVELSAFSRQRSIVIPSQLYPRRNLCREFPVAVSKLQSRSGSFDCAGSVVSDRTRFAQDDKRSEMDLFGVSRARARTPVQLPAGRRRYRTFPRCGSEAFAVEEVADYFFYVVVLGVYGVVEVAHVFIRDFVG